MILIDPLARPVIGHRGNRAHAPENTLASFQEAVALGVDAIEFDLRVSRDGVLMVFHECLLQEEVLERPQSSARFQSSTELQSDRKRSSGEVH